MYESFVPLKRFIEKNRYEIYYEKENEMSNFIFGPQTDSHFDKKIASYEPCLFVKMSKFLACIATVFIPAQGPIKTELVTFKSNSKMKRKDFEQGLMSFDLAKNETNPETKDVLIVIPGVNCSINEFHINELAR